MKTHTKRISRVLLSLFMLSALTLGAATPTMPVHAADATEHSIASGDLIPVQPSMLNADGTLNLSGGMNGALDVSGWDVTLDSKRGPMFSPAALPANTWSALTDNGLIGLDYVVYNDVSALAVIGSDLYVGGWFTQTFGGATAGLNRITKYNTLTNTWSALTDNGLSGTWWNYVSAFAVMGNDLYVGGYFTQTFGGATKGLNHIAKYNTLTNTWSALTDNGLNGGVYAFAVIGSDLYVGGVFTQTFGGATKGLKSIARYNTLTNTWSALTDNGLDDAVAYDEVRDLAVIGNDLYIGGRFTHTSGSATTGLNNIARYNTLMDTWSALTDNGLNYVVYALAMIGTDLYVGGTFTQTFSGATTGLNNTARYNTLTNTWFALKDNGLDHGVGALAVIGNDLYVGGGFTQTYGGATTGLNGIAKYNTVMNTWFAFTDNGLNYGGGVLAVIGNDLYVGGRFAQTYGGATTGLNHIARYTLPDPPLPPSPIFADVPFSHWANSYIESLYNAGITGGCSTSSMLYCPDATVIRAQIAIFILRGIHGSDYVPPAATGLIYLDVPLGSFADVWIEQLTREAISSGCGGGYYCPNANVTRAEMAIFLLRGKHGSDYYTPPPATGTVFGDVPLGSFADAWIEQLANEGITSGCGDGNYCPDSPVTRAEMAVFLVRAFSLP